MNTTFLLRIVLIISTMLIVMMSLMIQLIPIMQIISNTCNTMLFSNYVLFILHLCNYVISNTIFFFFLIAGDCTKMVGGERMRNVNSVYQRTRPAAPAADEEQSERRRRRRRAATAAGGNPSSTPPHEEE
jgi:hypothetical protein